LHHPATHRGSHPDSENTVGETDPPLVVAEPEVVDVSALDGPHIWGRDHSNGALSAVASLADPGRGKAGNWWKIQKVEQPDADSAPAHSKTT
jgi:hypothetical protein